MRNNYKFKLPKLRDEKPDELDKEFEAWFKKQTGESPALYYIWKRANNPAFDAERLKIKYLKAKIRLLQKKAFEINLHTGELK